MVIKHNFSQVIAGLAIAIIIFLSSLRASQINFDLYSVETIKNLEGRPLALAPDSTGKQFFRYATLTSNEKEKKITIWDTNRREIRQEIDFFGGDGFFGDWFSSHHKYLGIVCLSGDRTRMTELFDVNTGNSRHQLFHDLGRENINEKFDYELKTEGNDSFLSEKPIAIDSKGWYLATCVLQATISLWTTTSRSIKHLLKGHERRVTSVDFYPSYEFPYLASGSLDKTVRIWEYWEGVSVKVLKGHSDTVSCVAWNPLSLEDDQPNLLASGSHDKTVIIWDLANNKNVILKHDEEVFRVAWNPDGKMLAVGLLDGTIRVWNTHNGSYRDLKDGHKKFIAALTWSADGKKLISACSGEIVKIWTFMTKKEYKKKYLNEFDGLEQIVLGNN